MKFIHLIKWYFYVRVNTKVKSTKKYEECLTWLEELHMEKKKFKIGLIPKLILAIIIGILFGSFMPEWFNRVVVALSSIFSTFLSFIIPLMIVAYVTMGIANLRSAQESS